VIFETLDVLQRFCSQARPIFVRACAPWLPCPAAEIGPVVCGHVPWTRTLTDADSSTGAW